MSNIEIDSLSLDAEKERIIEVMRLFGAGDIPKDGLPRGMAAQVIAESDGTLKLTGIVVVPGWYDASLATNTSDVEQVLRNFNEDPTEDNAVGMVQEILTFATTSPAARAVAAERIRQTSKHGYTLESDAGYTTSELELAGMCYISSALQWKRMDKEPQPVPYEKRRAVLQQLLGEGWPWGAESFKPKSYLLDMQRGMALLAAAYDAHAHTAQVNAQEVERIVSQDGDDLGEV